MDLIVQDRTNRLELRMTAMNTRNARNRNTPLHRQQQIANSLVCEHIETLHLYRTESHEPGMQDLHYQYLETLQPSMLNLKKLVISVLDNGENEEFYIAVGAFVAALPRNLQQLKLFLSPASQRCSMVGFVPALQRSTWFELFCCKDLSSCTAGDIDILYDLSFLVGDCYALQQFSCHTNFIIWHLQAVCYLASSFPSLKRVQFLVGSRISHYAYDPSTFRFILDMVHTSDSIEAVDGLESLAGRSNPAFKDKCRKNRIQNCIKCIHHSGVLTVPIPTWVWPLILHKYSCKADPDALFYLLQQMHAAIIPTTTDGLLLED